MFLQQFSEITFKYYQFDICHAPSLGFIMHEKLGHSMENRNIAQMNNRHPWQLKKIRIVEAVLNLPDNSAHLAIFPVNRLSW